MSEPSPHSHQQGEPDERIYNKPRRRLTESCDGETCPNCSGQMQVRDFEYTCHRCEDNDVDYRRVSDSPVKHYYEVRAGGLYLRAPIDTHVSVYMSALPLPESPLRDTPNNSPKKREREPAEQSPYTPGAPVKAHDGVQHERTGDIAARKKLHF